MTDEARARGGPKRWADDHTYNNNTWGRAHVGVKVYKLHLRLGLVDGCMVERGFTGAVDIGVKWLKIHGFSPRCVGRGVSCERGPRSP